MLTVYIGKAPKFIYMYTRIAEQRWDSKPKYLLVAPKQKSETSPAIANSSCAEKISGQKSGIILSRPVHRYQSLTLKTAYD
jgi:hypothetical protein